MLKTVSALAVVAVSALTPAAGAQAATPAFQITRIYYDTPGPDKPVSNSKLNAEYVMITNVSTGAHYLSGFTLTDAAGHQFVFPAFVLKGGRSVTVHTGSGTDSSTNLYWGSRWYIWNNTRPAKKAYADTATLRTAAKALQDSCSYRGGSPGYTAC